MLSEVIGPYGTKYASLLAYNLQTDCFAHLLVSTLDAFLCAAILGVAAHYGQCRRQSKRSDGALAKREGGTKTCNEN